MATVRRLIKLVIRSHTPLGEGGVRNSAQDS